MSPPRGQSLEVSKSQIWKATWFWMNLHCQGAYWELPKHFKNHGLLNFWINCSWLTQDAKSGSNHILLRFRVFVNHICRCERETLCKCFRYFQTLPVLKKQMLILLNLIMILWTMRKRIKKICKSDNTLLHSGPPISHNLSPSYRGRERKENDVRDQWFPACRQSVTWNSKESIWSFLKEEQNATKDRRTTNLWIPFSLCYNPPGELYLSCNLCLFLPLLIPGTNFFPQLMICPLCLMIASQSPIISPQILFPFLHIQPSPPPPFGQEK